MMMVMMTMITTVLVVMMVVQVTAVPRNPFTFKDLGSRKKSQKRRIVEVIYLGPD